MKVHVSLDNVGYSDKPLNQIPKMKYRISTKWQEIELAELADLVGNKGYAMIPAHMVGGISAVNCVGIQLFALDFDHGSTFEQVKKKCDLWRLPIAFAYHTYNSSSEEERFRVVFRYHTVIEDTYIIKVVLAMLNKIFSESDSVCINPDRMFLGGKKLIYLDESAHIALVQLLFQFHESLNTNGNYKRSIENFCKKYSIMMFNHRAVMGSDEILSTFQENDDFMNSVIIHKIVENTKTSFFIMESEGRHKSITCKRKQRNLDVNCCDGCRLLDDFNSGFELSHEERFAILSNLMHIKGGEKHFFDILEKYYDSAIYEKWKKDVNYIRTYHPKRCSDSFCPYYADCEQAGTIVDTLAIDRKVYVRKETEYYPLEEAVHCLKQNLEMAYESFDSGIHLIKAQTSIGKTTQYIELIERHPEASFLIAVPTNMLKQQVTEDLLKKGIGKDELFMTLSIDDNIFFQEMKEEIQNAHARGIHNKKGQVLRKYYEEIKDNPSKKIVIEECRKLIKGINAVRDERVIVTTHAYFLQMPEVFLKKYTIIIDEDILQLQILGQSHQVGINCLKELVDQNVSGYAGIAGRILSAKENEYINISPSPGINPLTEEQMDELMCSENDNINDLQYAEVFVKKKDYYSGTWVVKYFCPTKLPRLKCIVLSATLNANIYKRYFGDRMPITMYPCKMVKYKGNVIQYPYHSLGRRDLSNKMQVFNFVRRLAGEPELEIITFKESASIKGVAGMNSQALNFGNTTGINKFAGKNLGIVGTPYKEETAYKLIAFYLGAAVNNKDDERPRMRRVEYKDMEFVITTYKDPLLREIQLYSLESELEQCIGRARLLRHACTVYVFSAFPCEQAKLHLKNYLLDM